MQSTYDILPKIRQYLLEILFSFVLAAISVSGYLLSTYDALDIMPIGGRFFVAHAIGFLIIWAVWFLVFLFIKNRSSSTIYANKNPLLNKLSYKKFWFVVFVTLLIFYIPPAIAMVGNLSYDSWNVIAQINEELPLNNGHPLIYTALMGVFIKTGQFIGDTNTGILLFSIFQTTLLAAIFATIIAWMRELKVSSTIVIASIVFYAIIPVNTLAGTVLWKDILFSSLGLLLLLFVRRLYVEHNNFFTKKNVAFFILLAFLFSTLRHNGFYAYVLAATLMIAINHRTFFSKKYLILFATPIALVLIYTNLISMILPPSSTPSGATLIIPMQQLARTAKYHLDDLSPQNREKLQQIIKINDGEVAYGAGLSDVAGRNFDVAEFNSNKAEYISLWANLLILYPKTFLAATAYNTYGYTYPFHNSTTTTDIIWNNCFQENAPRGCQEIAMENKNKEMIGHYRNLVSSTIPLQDNIGLYVCIMITLLYVSIIRRKKELIGVFILLGSLFLSVAAGPVNGDFRYLYLFVIAVPFVMASVYAPSKFKRVLNKHVSS